ncbi:MAG: VWA domain-containing protein [Candidatus Saganbacteria bacterium]|nr:VWA domain-containing protein [Candidatus Saganbacteria bacterium]
MKKILMLSFLLLISVFLIVGCGQTGTTTSSYNPTVDPGLLVDDLVPLSGSIHFVGGTAEGTVDINLNSILISGEPITLPAGRFHVYVGKEGIATAEWGSVDFTIPSVSDRPMDMVFIMDRTGSMGGIITAVKNSIAAFAVSLEAGGADVKFGVVGFGDDLSEQVTLALPATAETVATWLNSVAASGGGDGPENPLDSILYAYHNFTWRLGAQKVFVVITDNVCHQVGDGTVFTSTYLASVESEIGGYATVYAVSPGRNTVAGEVNNGLNGDIRDLADGLGCLITNEGSITVTQRTVQIANTGGKWIELPGSGDCDLNELGISAAVTHGYTLRFTYTFTAGTWYLHVMADTDGDGVMDRDVVIPIIISGGASAQKAFVPVQPLTKQQLMRLQY